MTMPPDAVPGSTRCRGLDLLQVGGARAVSPGRQGSAGIFGNRPGGFCVLSGQYMMFLAKTTLTRVPAPQA